MSEKRRWWLLDEDSVVVAPDGRRFYNVTELPFNDLNAMEQERADLRRQLAEAERERDRLATDALGALAGAGTTTPLEGYIQAPHCLKGDIERLGKRAEAAEQKVRELTEERDRLRARTHEIQERADKELAPLRHRYEALSEGLKTLHRYAWHPDDGSKNARYAYRYLWERAERRAEAAEQRAHQLQYGKAILDDGCGCVFIVGKDEQSPYTCPGCCEPCDGRQLVDLLGAERQRAAEAEADNLRLRGLDNTLRGEAQRRRDELADELVTERQQREAAVRLVNGLRKDLELSYVRRHQLLHDYRTSDGEYIEFEQCSLWVCSNAREKLAEWDAALLTEAAKLPKEG